MSPLIVGSNSEGSEGRSDRLGLPVGTSDPGTAEAGDLFYNTDTNKIRYYDGTQWNDLAAGGGGGGGGGGGSTAFVTNSVRFNSADEAYLTRNISSNITTFTLSMWVKRHGSGRDDIFVTDSNPGFFFYFHTDGKLKINTNSGNIFESTGAYNDHSAWYHICINNNGTTFNLYVNGVLDKSVTVSTALSSGAMLFARDRLTNPGNHSDISLAEIHFVEGQALNQTEFGEFDTTTGIWNPKEVSLTYGGAGFHLDFANGATDSSSNTNNFTAVGVVPVTYNGEVQYGEASTFDNSFDTSADVTLDTTGYSYSAVTNPKTDTGDANNATVLKTTDGTAIYWVFSDDNENTNRYIHQSANGINWTGALYQTSNGPVTIGPTPWVAWAGGANVDVTTIAWQSDAVLVDSPENGTASTGADPGGSIVGNYAVMNPLDEQFTNNGSFSEGNLKYVQSSIGARAARATIGVSSGKWYWEYEHLGGNASHGIQKASSDLGSYPGGNDADGVSWFVGGNIYRDGSTSTYAGKTFAVGDCIGTALDLDNGTVTFYKNNVSQGVAATGLTGEWFPSFGSSNVSNVSVRANFGQTKFKYAAPAGFKSLCSTNLPTPAISKGSSYVDAKPYNGTGGSNPQALGFTPDLLIIKRRDNGNAAGVVLDSIRGATKALETTNANSEKTNDPAIGSFDAGSNDGFTLTGTYGQTNVSGTKYAAWAWDAGETTNSVSAGGLNSSAYDTSQVWSNYLTRSGGSGFTNQGSGAFAGFDDANNYTYVTGSTSGTNYTMTFTPPNPISYSESLIIRVESVHSEVSIDGGSTWVADVGGLVTFEGSGSFTSIICRDSRGQFSGEFNSIRVDGVLLVDNGTTPPNVPTLATSYRSTPSAGCSVVSYSGSDSGSPNSVAHGLNKSPELYIIKNRTNNSANGWIANTTVIDGSVDYLIFNSNNAKADQGSPWSTTPTPFVFTLGANDNNTCDAGNDYIAYCFHSVEGFSRIGTFNNNDGEGSFVYCGFKPRIILAKNSLDLGGQTGVGDWMIYDTARNPRNGTGDQNTIALNEPNEEDGFYNANQATIDILSNGFKIKHFGSSPLGDSNRQFLFAAWAENPFALNSRAS